MRGRKFASNGMRQGATKHRTGLLDRMGSSVHGGSRAGFAPPPTLEVSSERTAEIIGVEVRYRTWVPVVVFDTPACNGWKLSRGGLIFDKNTRGVVLVAPGPKWDALRVIPGGIILIPEVSF